MQPLILRVPDDDDEEDDFFDWIEEHQYPIYVQLVSSTTRFVRESPWQLRQTLGTIRDAGYCQYTRFISGHHPHTHLLMLLWC